jgi:type II secretory pathway pseudopilin PulG
LSERLVVIAIIAILAALPLPARAAAKKQGQPTVGLANLKQIGLAFAIYLNDNIRFPDRRDLKFSLPGGFQPWGSSIGPRSATTPSGIDPRAGRIPRSHPPRRRTLPYFPRQPRAVHQGCAHAAALSRNHVEDS